MNNNFKKNNVEEKELLNQEVEQPVNELAESDNKFDYAEEGICCICGGKYTLGGNNPEPVMRSEEGRCCDMCNGTLHDVRLQRILQKLSMEKVS